MDITGIIVAHMERRNMTFRELAKLSEIPRIFFTRLNKVKRWDPEYLKRIGEALGIDIYYELRGDETKRKEAVDKAVMETDKRELLDQVGELERKNKEMAEKLGAANLTIEKQKVEVETMGKMMGKN